MDDIRVLIADDHPLYRRGLRSLLDAHEAVTVVAEAATGAEAVTRASATEPDVAVLDLHMPDLNGVEATRRIVATSPHIAVLVLTMFDDDDSVFAAMRAGARGYLLKGADQTEILRAIEGLARGEAIFGPSVAQRIIEFFTAPRHARIEPVFPQLTEREHEVLDLIAAGHNNTEIGHELVLSPKTLVLRHEGAVLRRQIHRLQLQPADRAVLAASSRLLPRARWSVFLSRRRRC